MSNDNKHDVPIAGHDYDGIQEFDNQLPRWWLYMFYISIVFAAGYWGYYKFGPGQTLMEVFEQEHAALQAAQQQAAPQGGADGERLLAVAKDPAQLEKGKTVYAGKCASCHGPQGQGSIGPNLTDTFWIHGGTLVQIATTVEKGVGEKGMPPWGPLLSQEELYAVTAYVKSLKGTNPPNPKAPQGTEVKD